MIGILPRLDGRAPNAGRLAGIGNGESERNNSHVVAFLPLGHKKTRVAGAKRVGMQKVSRVSR